MGRAMVFDGIEQPPAVYYFAAAAGTPSEKQARVKTYRREIDGLRAVALIPVMLFHAGLESFSGGYVGVDVFFVISGFLITSLILAEKHNSTFTIIGFYDRRARRILPALFVVMLCCIPFSFAYMLPSDLEDFSRSLIAVSLFASNILFWRESGYFDTAVEVKPLLHTWSLAVEEQYYVLFPLFILAVWRLGERRIASLVLLIALSSLALAHVGSYHSPAASFYLLPTRGWELLIGGLLALGFSISGRATPKDDAGQPRLLAETASLAGLAMIAAAVFTYGRSTPFPSLYALLPTLGTAAVIWFASPQTLVGRLLGSRLLVGIGLISYSTYLWHQPLFAFARLGSLNGASSTMLLSLCLVALGLAGLTWKLVEQPFRNRRKIGRPAVFALAIGLSAGTISFGLYAELNEGFTGRLSAKQRLVASFREYDAGPLYREGECFLRPEQSANDFASVCSSPGGNEDAKLFLWGDSHAAALAPGLRSLEPGLVQYTASGCAPIVNMGFESLPHCRQINDFVLKEVERIRPRKLVLHAFWDSPPLRKGFEGITATVEAIRRVSPGSEVFLLGDVPQWSPSLPQAMLRRGLTLDAVANIETPLLPRLRAMDRTLQAAAVAGGASFVSALDSLCVANACQAVSFFDGRLEPTVWDYGHLTRTGSEMLASRILPALNAKTGQNRGTGYHPS